MRSIKVSKQYIPIIEILNGTTKQFRTMRDLYIFAANLGYTLRLSAQPEEPTDIFDSRLLMENDYVKNSILSLALASSEDKSILLDENQEKIASIFEGYLEGGLDILKQYLDSNASDLDGNSTLIKLFQDKGIISIASSNDNESSVNF